MTGFRNWVNSKVRPQNKERKQQRQPKRDDLPFLPAQRLRPLTPNPSLSLKDKAISLRPRLHNYGLFGCLPYELRHQVLVEAFGGRTMHVDLAYDYPLVRTPKLSRPDATGERTHCGLGSELVPDTSLPKRWRWFSCVCHRRDEYTERELEERYQANEFSRVIETCDDRCLDGHVVDCEPAAAGCFVGIMGWLVACRQAYSDGIHVLYSTNTFHLSGLDLQLELPRLLLPQRLAAITSLELIWKLNSTVLNKGPERGMIRHLWDDPKKEDSSLHGLCLMLPQTFPNLRKLYVSFECWLAPPGRHKSHNSDSDPVSKMEVIFLAPVERMLCALVPGPGKEFKVAIQGSAWSMLMRKYRKLLGSKLISESADGLMRGKFWKSLGAARDDDDNDEDHDHMCHDSIQATDDDYGYWVCGGWEDTKAFESVVDSWLITGWGYKWTEVPTTF